MGMSIVERCQNMFQPFLLKDKTAINNLIEIFRWQEYSRISDHIHESPRGVGVKMVCFFL